MASALFLASLAVGCTPAGEPPMVVATAWPEAARRELGADGPLPILWVEVAPGDRLADVCDRRGGVDVVLGGDPAEYARLADAGRITPVEAADPAPWRVAWRPNLDRAVAPPRAEPAPSPDYADPRADPATLALARARLDGEGWARGYEGLVRRAARGRPIAGWSRGEGSALGDGSEAEPAECAAVAASGRNPDRARRFLRALAARGIVGPPAPDALAAARADGLLADLLGAALVDAHEELRDAELALRRHDRPRDADAAIGRRPPWPPASVAKLLAGEPDAPLADTLAEQIAPDPEARAWLKASWASPGRELDAGLLAELAGAVDGRLARDPRFRAWLRGEWTAWTRQVYRRVGRVAGGYRPS